MPELTRHALTLVCDHIRPLLEIEIGQGNAVTLCHPTRQGTILVLRMPFRSPLRTVRPPLVESPGAEDSTGTREIHCKEHQHWLLCRG